MKPCQELVDLLQAMKDQRPDAIPDMGLNRFPVYPKLNSWRNGETHEKAENEMKSSLAEMVGTRSVEECAKYAELEAEKSAKKRRLDGCQFVMCQARLQIAMAIVGMVPKKDFMQVVLCGIGVYCDRASRSTLTIAVEDEQKNRKHLRDGGAVKYVNSLYEPNSAEFLQDQLQKQFNANVDLQNELRQGASKNKGGNPNKGSNPNNQKRPRDGDEPKGKGKLGKQKGKNNWGNDWNNSWGASTWQAEQATSDDATKPPPAKKPKAMKKKHETK